MTDKLYVRQAEAKKQRADEKKNEQLIYRMEVSEIKQKMQKRDEIHHEERVFSVVRNETKSKCAQLRQKEYNSNVKNFMREIKMKQKDIKQMSEIEHYLIDRLRSTIDLEQFAK